MKKKYIGSFKDKKIGGRNLLRSTNCGAKNWNCKYKDGEYIIEDHYTNFGNGVKIICTEQSSGWQYVTYNIDSDVLKGMRSGEQYILKARMYSENEDVIGNVSIQREDGSGLLTDVKRFSLKANEVTEISVVLTTLSNDIPKKDTQKIYFYGLDKVGSYVIVNMSLTQGNVALCDWSPAFEDVIYNLYPIGSIKLTTDNVNPAKYLVGTTWAQIAIGKTLVGVGASGDKSFTPGQNDLKVSSGDITQSYLGVYVWKRTS